MTKTEYRIVVLIPSYDRPQILDNALNKWLSAFYVHAVIVVAEGSSAKILNRYQKILSNYQRTGRLIYKLSAKRLGSINARNLLLKLAAASECDFIVLADDDYLPPFSDSVLSACAMLNSDSQIGAIGGRVTVNNMREDGDFFLKSPFSATADILTKFSGYIFLDVSHGPRFSEYLTPFLVLKRVVADQIIYNEMYDTPTAFREESDLQAQIKYLGYKLVFYPELEVIHLAIAQGGNRPKISLTERIFWKARNSIFFVWKWNRSLFKRVWYTTFCIVLLLFYRPWNVLAVFRGSHRGIRDYFKCNLKEVAICG